MNKQKLYEEVANGYCTIKKGDKDIYIIDTEKVSAGTQEALRNIQQELGAPFELSYEIMASACACISDIELKDLEKAEFDTETASVYTGERLS